jgi:predicted ATPase/DNA-binding CsgD family transcriptional regulator
VGAGGIGKTRLALQVAREIAPTYRDWVWLTDLSAVSDSSDIGQTVGLSIGVRQHAPNSMESTLITELADKHTLLVLDNCEHLVNGCAEFVDQLLRGCLRLSILATSREALGVMGEVAWQVPGLSLPTSFKFERSDEIRKSEAVQLFVERAGTVRPDLSFTTTNLMAVAHICNWLEGLPLAIELVAARVQAISIDDIAARLDRGLLLAGGDSRRGPSRHRTFLEVLDWSYALLSLPERVLFGRLSVFCGGWTLDAADVVCADGPVAVSDVTELLSSLVSKSLILLEHHSDGTGRYRFLETVRQYAYQQATSREDIEATRKRHAAYFVELGERAFEELRGGPRVAEWLSRLQGDYENIRAALRCCLEHGQLDEGLQLSGAVWRFWLLRGSMGEGRAWLDTFLQRTVSSVSTSRGRALNGAGVLAGLLNDFVAAEAMHQASLRIWRELGDTVSEARSYNNLGALALHRGDVGAAEQLLTEAQSIAQAVGDNVGVARALANLEHCYEDQGNFKVAREVLEASTTLYAELHDVREVTAGLSKLGFWALAEGEAQVASKLCESALADARRLSDPPLLAWASVELALVRLHLAEWRTAQALLIDSLNLRGHDFADDTTRIAICVAGLAWVSAARQQPARALRFYSLACRLRDEATLPPRHARGRLNGPPFDSRSLSSWLPGVRAALPKEEQIEAIVRGKLLTVEDVLTEIAASVDGHGPADEPLHGLLTAREREIVQLLARGASNRDIADGLVIALSTAERHVSNILHKLGLRTRAQVASWVVSEEGRFAPGSRVR